jgi:hypothetical protein
VLARAQARLGAAGYHPTCVAGDGEQGYAPRAPYDRILGTCAVSRIPAAWLAQTAPGGLIVTTLNRAIGAGLVRLTVRDGQATGRVLEEDGRFMPLRAHRQSWADEALLEALTAEPTTSRTTLLSSRSVLDAAGGFEFFAGLALAEVAVAADPIRLVHPDGSWVRHRGAIVDQGGPRALWDLAEAAYRQWRALGRPRRHQFGFTATPTAQHFTLDGTTLTWPLPWVPPPALACPTFRTRVSYVRVACVLRSGRECPTFRTPEFNARNAAAAVQSSSSSRKLRLRGG